MGELCLGKDGGASLTSRGKSSFQLNVSKPAEILLLIICIQFYVSVINDLAYTALQNTCPNKCTEVSEDGC